MINCPFWLYLLSLILCSVSSMIITILIERKRKVDKWVMEIDRFSKYWLGKVKDTMKNHPSLIRPDEITIRIKPSEEEDNEK